MLVVMLLAGMAVGIGAAHLGLHLQAVTSASVVAMGIAFVLSLWPHIIIHEAGHALAGLARGMRLLATGIGPLRLERGSGGWRLRRGGGMNGIGGFAAVVPDGERGLSRTDQVLVLVGGPLANLVTAALCLAAALLWTPAPWVAGLLAGSAAAALLLALANLFPFHSQGWRSDGQGMLDLLRNSPDGALQLQVSQLVALTMAGVRPREWPASIQPATTQPDADTGRDAGGTSPMLAASADSMQLSRAVDLGDAEAAHRCAARLATRYWGVAEAMRPVVAVNMASHVALMVGDVALLDAWRRLCEGTSVMDLTPYRHWLDAELATLRGEDAAAVADAIAQARQTLPLVPDPVGLLLLGEFLDRLEVRTGLAPPTTAM